TADSPAPRCRCRQWPRDRAPRAPGRAQRGPSDPPARTHPPQAATAGVAPGPSCGTSSPSASSPRPTLCRVYHNLAASQRPSGHYSDGLLGPAARLDGFPELLDGILERLLLEHAPQEARDPEPDVDRLRSEEHT